MFKNPFSFEGRIRRTEYAFSLLLFFVALPMVLTLVRVSGGGEGVFFLLLLPAFWFMLAQGTKRCHDLGTSGWFQTVPFFGFWMMFADSKFGPNHYGPNPKGHGNDDDGIDRHLISR